MTFCRSTDNTSASSLEERRNALTVLDNIQVTLLALHYLLQVLQTLPQLVNFLLVEILRRLWRLKHCMHRFSDGIKSQPFFAES